MLKHENSEKKEQKGIISFELDKQGKKRKKITQRKEKKEKKKKILKK